MIVDSSIYKKKIIWDLQFQHFNCNMMDHFALIVNKIHVSLVYVSMLALWPFLQLFSGSSPVLFALLHPQL